MCTLVLSVQYYRAKINCDETKITNDTILTMASMAENMEIIFFNQSKQTMIHQKNHMDPSTTVHHSQEIEVDF